MHLQPDELLDIAEGARPESSAPHLAACARCRTQLQELRAMIAEVQDEAVPEPSPLFWDHLSSRVRAAVAEDIHPASSGAFLGSRWFRGAVAAAAGVLLAVTLSLRAPAPDLFPPVPSMSTVKGGPAELLGDVTAGDVSLAMVAGLTDQVDLETAREAGFAPRGSADRAVAHLSDSELRELGRLLQQELTRPGA
jgi:hypothetical protein